MSDTRVFKLFNSASGKTPDTSVNPKEQPDTQNQLLPAGILSAPKGTLLFSPVTSNASKNTSEDNEPNSIKVLRLLNALGKCNRAEFALAYQEKYNISPSLALSEIGKLERNGKILFENPEPLKPQSKLRTIEITDAGKTELIHPSYLKTQVSSTSIPGKVNLATGLLALLDDMSTSGDVKYVEYMKVAAKQFGHAQGRTTLSGRIANMQKQNGFVRVFLDNVGNKFISLTDKGKSKLAKDRELHQIENCIQMSSPRAANI